MKVYKINDNILVTERYNLKRNNYFYFITQFCYKYSECKCNEMDDNSYTVITMHGKINTECLLLAKMNVQKENEFNEEEHSEYENEGDKKKNHDSINNNVQNEMKEKHDFCSLYTYYSLKNKCILYKNIDEFGELKYDAQNNKTYLTLKKIESKRNCSFIIILRTINQENNVYIVKNKIEEISSSMFNNLSFTNFNHLYFRCNEEEKDVTNNTNGIYIIPSYDNYVNGQNDTCTVYCGLMGFIPIFENIRYEQKYHFSSLCKNIIDGDWLINYVIDRLYKNNDLAPFSCWLKDMKELLNTHINNRETLPYYYDIIFSKIYYYSLKSIISKLSSIYSNIDDVLLYNLIFSTISFYSYVPSSEVFPNKKDPSLCAGLPHFCTDIWRNWGRDTFISLTGCLTLLNEFDSAKNVILTYTQVIKNGLIPNLLNKSINPRYNCRDAVWYYLSAIIDYCKYSKEGNEFLLNSSFSLLKENMLNKINGVLNFCGKPLYYLEDLSDNTISIKENDIRNNNTKNKFENINQDNLKNQINIADIIHYILSCHANGIHYKEQSFGKELDEHMLDQGFYINISLTNEKFIIGGNKFNCGTWMDKMGSSEKAKNKGIPRTPRDGACIEINGLLYKVLLFILNLPNNLFPYKYIILNNQKFYYKEWYNLLQENFDKYFFIPSNIINNNNNNNNNNVLNDDLNKLKYIQHFNIYKDTLYSSYKKTDYQLRPNACIAISQSPNLFTSKNAIKYLNNVDKYLYGLNQLGLKTLSKTDKTYRGIYDNNNDSNDINIAHGWNYHNGPEWLWIYGHYLNSLLFFFIQKYNLNFFNNQTYLYQKYYYKYICSSYLYNHRIYIINNIWKSLPELTNENGIFCPFSCQAQTWSIATLNLFIYNLLSWD